MVLMVTWYSRKVLSLVRFQVGAAGSSWQYGQHQHLIEELDLNSQPAIRGVSVNWRK
mgnify:CR=1 FL=1